ncbi:MAG: hypothetical protein KZQ76_11140 [Candidatus Thiodiazotropha sp. (ex Epidulcina cf. delphinae)]|nr:hypothetical protein [Candidatus Thiodiazotropha sp. (ex Epidulcina cf. delphinae)]
MVIEHRRGEKPVPSNIDEFLNDVQLLALQKVEKFGWKLKFVRRPLFQDVVAVVSSPNDDRIGVLEMSGEINLGPAKIRLRA